MKHSQLNVMIMSFDYPDSAKKAKQDQLNLAVPGLNELRAARDAYYHDRDRYEQHDGANHPVTVNSEPYFKYDALCDEYPRALLYLKAEAQYESALFVDNTGLGAAGKKAMYVLAEGGDIDDALSAMAERTIPDRD